MKFNQLLIFFVVILFTACSKSEEPVTLLKSTETESSVLNKRNNNPNKTHDLSGVLTYNYTTTFDLQCTSCESGSFSTGSYFGEGELPYLGEISSKTSACISYIIESNNIIGLHVESQCASFFTSRGDELFLSNDPYDLYFNSNGEAVGVCQFYFNGGTGRYKKACGSFKGNVVNNLMGQFKVEIEGILIN